MAPIERYVRASANCFGTEVHAGLELRHDDNFDQLAAWLQGVAKTSLMYGRDNHVTICRHAEAAITIAYPGRAFFIESEIDGKGQQIYQPMGMPRKDKAWLENHGM